MYEHRDDIQPAAASGDQADVVHRRLRWALWAAVIVTLVAAIPGVLLDRGGDAKSVTAAQRFVPATTTTTAAAPAAGAATPPLPTPTTVPAGVVTAVHTAPALGATTTTVRRAVPAPAPAQAKPCRNSYDPACGPFRWDPSPGSNAPLTVTVSPQSQQVKAGTEVNFHVVADDPDAKIDRCYAVDFGDGQRGSTCPPPAACQTPYGPWSPPAKVHDHYEIDVKHTYATARPDAYVASFQVQSHSFCNPDPYGGSGQAPATVKVS
jgi:hypothetical protein